MIAEQPAGVTLTTLYERELAAALDALQHKDTEALHDFRIALRRLQVLLRQLAQPDAQRKAVLRRIKALMTQSNRGRDAQVMLAWLEREWPHLDEREQSGAQRWQRSLKRMQRHRPLKRKQTIAVLKSMVPPLAKLAPPEGMGPLPLGVLVARRLEQQARDLVSLMNDEGAAGQLHFIRLKAKSVRYLLLPFCDALSACADAQKEMQQLQNHLGDWHDSVLRQQSLINHLRTEIIKVSAETNAEEALNRLADPHSPLPGLMALVRFNVLAQQRMVRTITRNYLRDGGSHLMGRLEQAIYAIRRAATPVG